MLSILKRRWDALTFRSAEYWDRRYRDGGNSGAGSYNRLARFKADTINAFVEQHSVKSVIEFGSGDGAQLRLAHYPAYVGIDVSPHALERTRAIFAGDVSKSFMRVPPPGETYDLSLSLDVIYHLIEDAVFERYMADLFDFSHRFVIVYASNVDEAHALHVRHRKFTDWVETHRPEARLLTTIANPFPWDPRDPDNTSFADFYVYEVRETVS